MTITRRRFILTSSSTLAYLTLSVPKVFTQTPEGTFTTLRGDIGTFEQSGGTIGWLATKEALVVVDTQFPESAKLCWNGLQKKTIRKIDVLLNTHHHGDHTAGNLFFKDYTARIVAHKNVPELQRKAAEQRGTLPQQVYANETFEKTWEVDLGIEIITATYHGPAHTSGDAIIHFQKANVLHMGDLIFNRIPPYIDRPAGASIKSWVVILEKIHELFSNETIFIFGHGNPDYGITGKRQDVLAMRDFLSGLLEFTQKGMKQGKSKDEIAAVERLPKFTEYYSERRKEGIPHCIKIAHDELTEG